MGRTLLALALSLTCGACGKGPVDLGFAIAVTLVYDASVDDATLAKVSALVIGSTGEETYTRTVPLGRGSLRTERIVYRPGTATRQIALSAIAIDADLVAVARGEGGVLALVPGQTTELEIVLSRDTGDGGAIDLTSTQSTDLAGADLSGGGFDASTADAAVPSITWIQQTETSTTASTLTITAPAFATTPKGGDAILCWVDYNSGTASVSSIGDAQGNTYVRAAGPLRGAGALAGWSDEIWYTVGISGGASSAVTALFSASVANKNLSCHEYSGLAKSSPLDQAVTASFSGPGVHSLPAVTTAKAPELVFSGYNSFGSLSTTAEYTVRSTLDGDLVQDRVLTTPGTWPVRATSTADCGGLAAFFVGQ